jgi:predicted MFS family arabinose efflux permease
VFVAAGVVGSPMAGYMPDLMARVWPDLSTAATYRATLLASGAISAFSLYALFQLRETARPDLPPTSRDVVIQCYRSPAVRRLFITGLFLSFGGGLIVPFFNVFFQQELGASTGAIGVITALGIVVTVVGSLGAPWLGGRVGLVWAVILARLLSAPLLLLMGLSPIIVLAAAFFALRTFLVYMSDPLHTDFSMRIVPPEIRATTNSLTFMSWNITLAVGGVIGGQLIARSGYELPFILGSAVTVVAACVYWLAFRRYDTYGRAVMAAPDASRTEEYT